MNGACQFRQQTPKRIASGVVRQFVCENDAPVVGGPGVPERRNEDHRIPEAGCHGALQTRQFADRHTVDSVHFHRLFFPTVQDRERMRQTDDRQRETRSPDGRQIVDP